MITNRWLMAIGFVVAGLSTGCAHKANIVQLSWKVPAGKQLHYATYFSGELKSEDKRKIYRFENPEDIGKIGFELMQQPQLLDELLNRLEKIKPEETPIETRVFAHKGNFRALTEIVEKEYTSAVLNAYEADVRRINAKFVGNLKATTDFSQNGQLLSFYMSQKEKNGWVTFTYLPREPVSVGDSWDLPVFLTEVGEGFIPIDSDRVSRAKLENIWIDKEKGKIARISYVVSEKVQGKNVYYLAEKELTHNIGFTIVGFSDFLIDSGYLLQNVNYKLWMSAAEDGRKTEGAAFTIKTLTENIAK